MCVHLEAVCYLVLPPCPWVVCWSLYYLCVTVVWIWTDSLAQLLLDVLFKLNQSLVMRQRE